MGEIALVVHGARGSAAVAAPEKARFGGHTTCFQIDLGDPYHIVVIDAGTGMRRLQKTLPAAEHREYHIYLTHLHWDHIQGLPFFEPLFSPDNRVVFYSAATPGELEADLAAAIRPPFFPVGLDGAQAEIGYASATGSGPGGLEVTTTPLHHPQGSTAFRFASGNGAAVIATDHEHGRPDIDAGLVDLAGGADVLIHDGQYLPDEYRAGKVGWGHSTWEGAVATARAAGVGRLLLSSHDPDRTDDQVDRIIAAARDRFPATDGAAPGQRIPL